MTEYKTTKADFKQYKAETIYWVDKFGLTDFELFIEHIQMEEDCRAQAQIRLDGCIARSILQKIWDDIPINGEIQRVAFHEVMEIILSPIWILAGERYVTESEIERAKHSIIRRFENVIWKPDFEKHKGRIPLKTRRKS